MYEIFIGCISLKHLNISKNNEKNCINMIREFKNKKNIIDAANKMLIIPDPITLYTPSQTNQ